MMSFETFKSHLETLHKMEMQVETEHGPLNEGHMMYNNEKEYGNNFFSYEYDALVIVLLRFNDDGTIDQWFETLFEEVDAEKPHASHSNAVNWMSHQIEAITP